MKKLYVFLVGLLCGVTFAQAQCTINISASPTSPVCAGTCVMLHADGANAYQWTPGSLSDSIVIVCPTTTTTYTAIGTDLSSNTCSALSTITVLPVDNASFTYPSQIYCQGNSGMDPSATITGGASGTFSATPVGLVFLNTSTGSVDNSASTPNTYTITFTTNGTCPASSSTTLSINFTPTATVPANIVVCNNSTVAATNFTSTPPGATYTWTNSNTAIGLAASGTGNIPSFTATNSTAGNIISNIVVVPSLNGCYGAHRLYSITVRPTPTVTVPTNITACIGSLIPQTNFVTSPAGGTFVWTNSNTSIGIGPASGSTNMPAFSATNSGSSPISATITVTPTVNYCVGLPSSYTITVNPVPNVTASATPNPACAGQSIYLSALPAGASLYNWTGPAGYTNTLQNPVIVSPFWSSGTFTVNAVYSGYMCTNTVTVTVHPNPNIVFSPTNPVVCPGSCIVLSATGGNTYLWQPGNLTGTSITVCPAVDATYNVLATNSGGCTGTATVNVTVGPSFSFSVTPSNATIPSGQCADFNITTAGTYVWTPSTGLNTNVGQMVSACPTATTTYTVMGTNQTGCTGTTTVTVHITGNYIDDVSGSTSCHLPYLAVLNIVDDIVQPNDTILYNLNYGDGSDTTFTLIYQNNPTPMASITHAYTAMGTYSPWTILQHTNGLSDTIHTQNLIVASDTCGDISGRAFYDMNLNCTADVGEFMISNALIKLYNTSHALVQAQFTDADGFYSFNVPNGTYNVEIDSAIYNSFSLVCPSGGIYNVSGFPASGKNYGLNCSSGFDLYGSMTANTFRPGLISQIWLTIGNWQCAMTSANVKFVLDPRTSYVSYGLPPSGINGDTITWTLNHLSAVDTAYRTILLTVYVSPTAVINDSLLFKLNVNPIIGDVNPLNNYMTKKYRIMGSFDPNAKEVSPSGNITKNTDLTYTVHFQNTGNAEAYNIYILDTLDAHLDLSTLEMVAASHPYSVEILNSTQKDVLKFFFPNIMLPDSGSNQMLSNGFVSYKIRPLANCVEGTIITNMADIYFDYNPAVPTNMVQNQIPLLLGVNEETIPSTRDRVIPNPVSQQATLTYAVPEQGKTVIKLFDITGKESLTLLHQDLDAGEHRLTFDCKDLKSGIYFIRICTSRSSSVVKLVKL